MDVACVAAATYHGACLYYSARKGFPSEYTRSALRQLVVHAPLLLLCSVALPTTATYWHEDVVRWSVVLWTLLFLVIADGAMYWFHRACHRYTPLRRMHATHHAHVDTICWSTGVLHPCEAGAMIACLMLGPALLPRAPVGAVYCTVGLFVLLQVQEHEGGTKHDGAPWLVDSRFHGAHHRRMQGNYAFVFSAWDSLFRTELAD